MPISEKPRERLNPEWRSIKGTFAEGNGTNLASPLTKKIAPTAMSTSTIPPSWPLSTRALNAKLDYMESLMIKLHQTGPGNGFNEDEGRRVYTKQWDPLLIHLRQRMGINVQSWYCFWFPTPVLRERGGGIYFLSMDVFGSIFLSYLGFLWCLCVQCLCLIFILSHSWMMISPCLSKYPVVVYTPNTYVYTQMKNFLSSSISPYVQWL